MAIKVIQKIFATDFKVKQMEPIEGLVLGGYVEVGHPKHYANNLMKLEVSIADNNTRVNVYYHPEHFRISNPYDVNDYGTTKPMEKMPKKFEKLFSDLNVIWNTVYS